MIVVVCGSRSWTSVGLVEHRLRDFAPDTVIVHGGAKGADSIAGAAATRRGLHTAVVRPLWSTFGNRAGHVRNTAMLSLRPDLVVAFWDGRSNGTRGTIEEADRRGIRVEIIRPTTHSAPRVGQPSGGR